MFLEIYFIFNYGVVWCVCVCTCTLGGQKRKSEFSVLVLLLVASHRHGFWEPSLVPLEEQPYSQPPQRDMAYKIRAVSPHSQEVRSKQTEWDSGQVGGEGRGQSRRNTG